MNKFNELYELNVSKYIEKKNGLNYLSWSHAWGIFKQYYKDARFEVQEYENGAPYFFDPALGYMVKVRVTANGETQQMQLPVMDNRNNAMKDKAYTLLVGKNKTEVEVQPATMFDINTAIQRCTVKACAMFGLGLYIYAGEDLPRETTETKSKKANENLINRFKLKLEGVNTTEELNALFVQMGDWIEKQEKSVQEAITKLGKQHEEYLMSALKQQNEDIANEQSN